MFSQCPGAANTDGVLAAEANTKQSCRSVDLEPEEDALSLYQGESHIFQLEEVKKLEVRVQRHEVALGVDYLAC
jgi:hypothetical protein